MGRKARADKAQPPKMILQLRGTSNIVTTVLVNATRDVAHDISRRARTPTVKACHTYIRFDALGKK